MDARRTKIVGIAVVCVVFYVSSAVGAQGFSIFSTFDDDTPGSPPATGGPDQPTGIVNGGVLVQASANGIATQPVVAADSDCSASSWYFGGVYYDLPTPVTEGVLRVEVTVAANQITTGIFFDAGVQYYGNSVARLRLNGLGQITDYFDTVLGTYTANTPLRLRADIDMDSKTWACSIDEELDGFDDDPVTTGLAFTNDPAIITQVGTIHLDFFGSFNQFTCVPPRTFAYDDVFITTEVPIFADGFEAGNTSAWSDTVGLADASVNWYSDASCTSHVFSGGPFGANACAQMPGESIYIQFDCASGSSAWYWDDQCKSLRSIGCDPDLCCAVPFSAALESLVWTCS